MFIQIEIPELPWHNIKRSKGFGRQEFWNRFITYDLHIYYLKYISLEDFGDITKALKSTLESGSACIPGKLCGGFHP